MKAIVIHLMLIAGLSTACGDGGLGNDGSDGSGSGTLGEAEGEDATSSEDASSSEDATSEATDETETDEGTDTDNPIGLGPARVDLGTAENYVILAKSGISTTGASAVVGDIALSPADATYITGFGLTSPPTTFTTSALVTGQVFAADYDPPTPTNLTTAVADMETAYTDAAGRPLPDYTELGNGNIDGMTLEPGLYKWGTGVLIPTGVTLEGSANDVWIFQIAEDLTLGNGAMIDLSGGAVPENVFWQVAGQATFGTTSSFEGVLLSQTLIEFNTGAVMTGRALAQTAVTLDATMVTSP